mmetsp:Transcript_63107/g.176504  ORF Transcript_63107/g.176504 Transcript_63107/m.176504 type:complete len:470 (-) Transcript_63107:304-1713(-)
MSREHAQIGKVGGIYCLGRKLGAGSFGDIYFAVNTQTGEELAVKCESVKSKHPMLMYEAKLVKHLQGVPGIATVHYCDVEGDYNVMVMDLLGPSLEDLFNGCQRKFSLKTVLMIGDQMLYRIENLHSKSFIHRDIKPDNFLYGLDRVVKLADFGLALVMPKPKSPFCGVRAPPGIEGIVGTAPYMSPEMLLGDKYDHRTDSWSYGVSVYFMVYGEFPYGAHAKTRSSMKSAIATGVPKPPYKPDEKVICKDADGSMIQQMAKGYLECLLDRSPKTRWSSKQALGAQFFSERAQLLWSSSDTTSSIDLQLMVETARTITREFDDKNNLDVTIETGLDVLLSKLQQQHGASSSELRRAFSLPVPAKAKPGTHLEPLTEEDELFTEILTRVSSCSSVNTVRRAITHDGAASMSSEAAFAMQVNELDDMPSESGALKGDWSEETWSDESTGDLPPPLPRLPPCHAAVAAVCGR